jgi:phage tail-like protein
MKTKTIVLSAVVVLALLAGGIAFVALGGGDDDERRTGAIAATRSYSAGNFFLEINGTNVGALKSIDGCGVEFETVAAVSGTDKAQTKHVGQPKYGPCQIRFGSGLGPAAYQWIMDALAGKNAVRDAAIVIADVNLKAQSRLALDDAILTKFTLPALDPGSKDPAYFELTLTPEQITKSPGGGSSVGSTASKSAKQMLLGNFRVTSPALPNLKASKVESWSFESPVAREATGSERLPTVLSGPAQLGDVSLLASEPVQGLDDWVSDQVKGTAKETTLLVELLDPTLKSSLLELSFTGVGLTQADLIAGAESATDTVQKRGFSMFVQGASIKFSS